MASNGEAVIVPKPQTNADRIRAMSDEELDKWASAITLDKFGDKKDWLYWPKKDAQVQTQSTNTSAVSCGKCDKICSHKTDLGYCAFTACINPDYNGSQNYGVSNSV